MLGFVYRDYVCHAFVGLTAAHLKSAGDKSRLPLRTILSVLEFLGLQNNECGKAIVKGVWDDIALRVGIIFKRNRRQDSSDSTQNNGGALGS